MNSVSMLRRCLLTARYPGRTYKSSSSAASSSSETVKKLQDAFRDPSSPFYLPPGATGPASPDDHAHLNTSLISPHVSSTPHHARGLSTNASIPRDIDLESSREEAKTKLLAQGYDPTSFWEQSISWGFHDAFQHVNNVHYVRFFESGRMKWVISVGNELGGSEAAQAMLKGQGISFILKSINIRYRRPVTFPDTLLIAHKPYFPEPHEDSEVDENEKRRRRNENTEFDLHAIAYSYAQNAVVADSQAAIVWYDYDKLRKCDPGEQARAVIRGRARTDAATSSK